MKRNFDFDLAQWRGLERLGYRKVDHFGPKRPAWLPRVWLPEAIERQDEVIVYRRHAVPAAPAPATTNPAARRGPNGERGVPPC